MSYKSAQGFHCFFCGGILHQYYLQPFSARIHHDQLHAALKRTSKVYVQMLPWCSWVFPTMQWYLRGIVCDFLTSIAVLHCPLYIFIHLRPPRVASAQPLHLCHAYMAFMECVQHSASQLQRNYHSSSPHQHSVMNNYLGTVRCVRCELVAGFKGVPTLFHESDHSSKVRIPPGLVHQVSFGNWKSVYYSSVETTDTNHSVLWRDWEE